MMRPLDRDRSTRWLRVCLGELSARIDVPLALRERLRPGATLAVSLEPPYGAPHASPARRLRARHH